MPGHRKRRQFKQTDAFTRGMVIGLKRADESHFCLSSDSRRVRVWRRRGERSNPAAIVERPTVRQRGIMVWGAIAYDSRSPLLRIQGTMTAQRYVDDVLRPVTLPYLQGVPNALYQQDNARPHTARISQQALQDVQMLPWPPYSPDLSLIEHVWDIIGRRLHALPQPRSEDELWQMVEREWRAISQDAIRTLIDSLPRRVAACIAVRGAETSAFLAETKDSWIADSGATDHMTFRREWFSTFEEIPEGVHPVCLGDGKKIYAKDLVLGEVCGRFISVVGDHFFPITVQKLAEAEDKENDDKVLEEERDTVIHYYGKWIDLENEINHFLNSLKKNTEALHGASSEKGSLPGTRVCRLPKLDLKICDGSSLEFRMSKKPRVVGITLMKGVDPASIKEDAGIVVSSEQMVEETSKQIAVEESKRAQVVKKHFAEDGERAQVEKRSVVEVDESHRAEVKKESVEADEEKGLDAEQGTDSKVAEKQDADLENGKDSEAETKDNGVGDSKTAIKGYESVSNSKAVAEGADQVEISDGETESIDDIEKRVVRVPASRKLVEARQTGDAEFKVKGCYFPDRPVFECGSKATPIRPVFDDASCRGNCGLALRRDASASDPDSSKGKAQGSQEVPEIAVEDSDEKSAIEDSQPSEPLDVEGSGVGASSDVEVRAQTKSPKVISSKITCMKKEESSIDLEEEDTGRNEPSPASITFKALETTDSKEIDLTILGNNAREHCAQKITFEQSNVIRTLGLGWIQSEDCFLCDVQSLEKTSVTTKREMLSFIAKNTQGVKLHGFGDASEDAYAAAVYIRIPTDDGVSVTLLASKTKLAPMRKMSIPRLELCAALLLTRLVKYIMEELSIKMESAACWSDSTIVLSWLRIMSGNLPTFIGNRVAEIQSCPQVREWRYVPTGDNPADIASRGIMGSELKQYSIWWTGPTWLSAESTEWPRVPPVFEHQSQTELLSIHAISETPFLVAIGEMSSTFNGYIRKVAWILRYCHNYRYSAERYQSHLSTVELRNAHRRILQAIHCQPFREEIRSLTTLGSVKRTGKIYGSTPILDDQGILRVGGRLRWAPSMTYEQKHPALLPSSGKVAQMIVKAVHMRTLHGSVHLMLSTLRQKYWILRVKDQVKRCIRECVTCCRYNRVTPGQLMSDLPKERLTPGKPFSINGVDHAGPVNLRLSKGRGRKTEKGYICLFVCFVTRAVHLELVTDASTPTFMSAFKRFVARRGHCTRLYNDQGVVTPAHFLLAEPSSCVPEDDLLLVENHLLTRWQLVQRVMQHLWKRWSKDYLNGLQQRNKWKTISPNVDINTLVLIKEERMPPARWLMGRVVETHPGKDGLVRVVSVRTSVGVLRRPLVKLVLLPVAPPELDVTHQLGEEC
ncbi:hypothetical protein LAZ67_11001507 [Cordylochernes scorpioides]|uniref:Uncharacterized protein n=1 Tax=Cordylochernes scorpioides TaxID=51811 RepID=A0ABY6L3D6_9ARAC|nr:hypothetical protein LAZ67_11001507 [Cordylochernes scorpioides]